MLNLIFTIIASVAFSSPKLPKTIEMPTTEIRFSTEIHDEFKWLENPADGRISNWINEQNEYTKYKLKDDSYRDIYLDFEELYIPSDKSFSEDYFEFDREHFLIERTFIPSPRTPETEINSNVHYTLNLINESGGDYKRLNIYKNGENNTKALVDTLHLGNRPQINWKNENEFYYIHSGHHLSGDNNMRLLLHKIGEHQADDKLIYRAQNSNDYFYVSNEENRFTLVLINFKTGMDDYFALTENGKGEFLYSLPENAVKKSSSNDDYNYYVIRYDEYSNGAIYNFNLASKTYTLLVSNLGFTINEITPFKDDFIIKSSHDGAENLYYYKTDRKEVIKLPLPSNRIIYSYSVENNKIYAQVASYNVYLENYLIDLNDFNSYKIGERNFSEYDQEIEIINEHYIASNGQKAAIHLVKFKSTPLTPQTPIFMEGYGGFRFSMVPYFNPDIIPWLKRGGVYASIILPGGFEYGMDWFKSGILQNKKNTFDSYALAAKHLINKGYTSTKHLGIGGVSNGGLLASATAMLYPNLFSAVVPEVGVHDLLNFQFFTSGKYWIDNYGEYDNEEDFKYFYKLSPYHNVQYNETFPDTLILTAQQDDRVVPSHSYKLTAKLQKYFPNKEILLFAKPMGSHSSRSGSIDRRLETYSLKWNFLVKKLMK